MRPVLALRCPAKGMLFTGMQGRYPSR